MRLLHDKFLEDFSAVLAFGICHAKSANRQKVVLDLGICMTNEGKGELCTLIKTPGKRQPNLQDEEEEDCILSKNVPTPEFVMLEEASRNRSVMLLQKLRGANYEPNYVMRNNESLLICIADSPSC